jgi:hypothetical protein
VAQFWAAGEQRWRRIMCGGSRARAVSEQSLYVYCELEVFVGAQLGADWDGGG